MPIILMACFMFGFIFTSIIMQLIPFNVFRRQMVVCVFLMDFDFIMRTKIKYVSLYIYFVFVLLPLVHGSGVLATH